MKLSRLAFLDMDTGRTDKSSTKRSQESTKKPSATSKVSGTVLELNLGGSAEDVLDNRALLNLYPLPEELLLLLGPGEGTGEAVLLPPPPPNLANSTGPLEPEPYLLSSSSKA